ncbi:MAG: hypothetical protein LM576_04135 [Thermofilum sp.]|nr:hypothetical protein [Thermofilum sp.]
MSRRISPEAGRAGFAVRLAARSYEEEAWLEGKRLLYHDGSRPAFEYLSASGGARGCAVSGDLEYYKAGYVRNSALSEVPEDAHPALGERALNYTNQATKQGTAPRAIR